MQVNLSNSFTSIFDFLISTFRSVLHWLDSIIIFGDSVSLLDLNIAFAVMGLLFSALFAVVHNSVSGAASDAADGHAERDRAYQRRHHSADRRAARRGADTGAWLFE